MIYLLTSNTIQVKSINQYADNFIFAGLYSEKAIPSNNPNDKRYQYTLYPQDGIAIEDDYESNTDFQFTIQPESSIQSVLDSIVDQIRKLVNVNLKAENPSPAPAKSEEDMPDTMNVVVACDIDLNNQITKYLVNKLDEEGIDAQCLNLYRYLGIVNIDKLVSMIKTGLNTDFVYPDDPVAFGYALYQMIGGLM